MHVHTCKNKFFTVRHDLIRIMLPADMSERLCYYLIQKLIRKFKLQSSIIEPGNGKQIFHNSDQPLCDKCGAKTIIRKDDQPETVLDRLAVYHKTTEPLKAYYEKQGKLETVIGQEEVADTTALVLKAVGVK